MFRVIWWHRPLRNLNQNFCRKIHFNLFRSGFVDNTLLYFRTPWLFNPFQLPFNLFYTSWRPLPICPKDLRTGTEEFIFNLSNWFKTISLSRPSPPCQLLPIPLQLCASSNAPASQLVASIPIKAENRIEPFTDISSGSFVSPILNNWKPSRIIRWWVQLLEISLC